VIWLPTAGADGRLRVALRDIRTGLDEPVVETEHFTIDLAAQQVTREDRRPAPNGGSCSCSPVTPAA